MRHLTAGTDAGGLSRYLLDLCRGTVDRGHEVILAGQAGAWHEQFRAAGWPWIELPLKGGVLGFWRSVKTLRAALAVRSVDLIHSHYRRATLLGRKLQQDGSPPLLYTLHLSHMPLNGVNRLFRDFGDHVLAPSRDGLNWLVDEAGVPSDRISEIPHGIDSARFPVADEPTRKTARDSLGLDATDLVAAYVGRLDYPKNVDWIIRFAAESKAALPGLKVVLAGDGPDESTLRAIVAGAGVTNRVRFLGHRDPLPVYQAADALLLPSLREGFSLACAEAMCVGIPVLRTRTSGTTELIVEGATGRSTLINPTEFVSAAIEFMSDIAKLRQTGRAAAAHVRAHFTFDRQIGQTLALYQRLVDAAHTPTAARPRRA